MTPALLSHLPPPPPGKTGWPWTVESEPLPPTMPDGRPWPKISIVTPSYNQATYVGQTLISVLNQGYPNLEYVVIDGGSTDGSREIIASYADKLHYWVSEPDGGHGNALNKGFAQTSGEIMAWINSDDLYTPWAFSVVADIFASLPDIEWVVGVNGAWDVFGRQVRCRRVYKNVYDFLLGDFAWIQQESVFWRRSLWERAGGRINEDYRLMVDGELWCRFFEHAELWHVPATLAGYRIHGGNRASIYYDDVVSEMNRAIEGLRARSSGNILKNSDRLFFLGKCIRRLNRTKLPLQWSRIIKRCCPILFKAATYAKLEYCHASYEWKPLRKEFTL